MITNQQLAGGYAASHPVVNPFPIVAATATRAERNVVRQELVSVACWRLNDLRFDFDSSFVRPEAHAEMLALRRICETHPGSPMSIFGHSDPTGDEDYNKVLSGRRAEAVYAVLTHDPARWEALYSKPHGGDEWGKEQIGVILDALAYTSVIAFQKANGLIADGVAGPKTRPVLFQKYFEFLFPVRLEKSAFLGGGTDPGGKGDFQGCGEFNPAMIFSAEEKQKFELDKYKAERDAENSVNRRVLILFFRPGTSAPMDRWPCPRANEGVESCKRRFWSDAQTRRANSATRRTFADNEDTFSCRFYHRFADNSPCELSAARLLFVEIYIDLPQTSAALDDEFELVSADGEYRRRLARSAAIPRNEFQHALVFPSVISGQSYSLYRHLPGGIQLSIFDAVPFDSITGNASTNTNFRFLELRDHEHAPGVSVDHPWLQSSAPVQSPRPVDPHLELTKEMVEVLG